MLDYSDMADRHEAEQEAKLEKLPVCCECDKPIQDDMLCDINGDLYCESCSHKNFWKPVDYYIKD